MFTYGEAGWALTKSFEGLELSAYQDRGGVWTIGYGHTGADVRPGMTITEDEANALLAKDLSDAVECVNQHVKAINQNQFDALVDFTFNLGCEALLSSTLLRRVNDGDIAGAAAQFLRWDHVKGNVVPGLTRRRQAEAELFQREAA